LKVTLRWLSKTKEGRRLLDCISFMPRKVSTSRVVHSTICFSSSTPKDIFKQV
jgi:hypothetical protein